MFVTKTLEDPLRRVPRLAVNRAILFQNAVDDIRERRQLRALRRLASPISRRFRMQQYLGNRGKEGKKHADKKLRAGRGGDGKAVAAGVKQRGTGRVRARVVADVGKPAIHAFVAEGVSPEANVYTDDLKSYLGIPNPQATVRHSAGEYVNCMAHTNGIESFWSTLKRAYHVVSHKHLDRYVGQFVAKHNLRDEDTGEQMGMVAGGMMGRRLSYRRLTGRGAA